MVLISRFCETYKLASLGKHYSYHLFAVTAVSPSVCVPLVGQKRPLIQFVAVRNGDSKPGLSLPHHSCPKKQYKLEGRAIQRPDTPERWNNVNLEAAMWIWVIVLSYPLKEEGSFYFETPFSSCNKVPFYCSPCSVVVNPGALLHFILGKLPLKNPLSLSGL